MPCCLYRLKDICHEQNTIALAHRVDLQRSGEKESVNVM